MLEVQGGRAPMGVRGLHSSAQDADAPEDVRASSADSGTRQAADDGLQALAILARLHHVVAEPVALRHELGLGETDPVARQDLLLAAKHLGLKAKASLSSPERLTLAPLPALAV